MHGFNDMTVYCNKCFRYFTSNANLQRHQSNYSKCQFSYPCCQQRFDWTKALRIHRCPQRRETFPVSSEADLEMLHHDKSGTSTARKSIGIKKYRCDGCPASFNRYSLIKKHVIENASKHYYVCPKCEKYFSSEERLRKHLCLLAGGTFLCSCNRTFNKYDEFKKHIGRPYTCCACDKKCRTVNNLINHIRAHTKQSTFFCNICGRSFRVRESLRIHMRIHSGKKEYQCSNCSYSSITKWNLQLHEITHNSSQDDKRNFICAICERPFTWKHHLRRHLNTHNQNESNFQLCRICGKSFSQNANLSRHLERHRRDSKVGHKCVVCEKEMRKGDMYQHHVETKHFTFVCDPCEKVFASKFNLQRHVKTHKLSDGK